MQALSNATPASSRPALPPGPRGHWLLGVIPDFRRDPLGFFGECARTYGDVSYMRLLNVPIYFINRPDLIEQVLVTEQRNFLKTPGESGVTRVVFGNGLLTSDGEVWLRQRRLAQPAFHRQHLAAYGEIMLRHAARLAGTWHAGERRDLQQDMMAVTLAIAVEALFGADVTGQAREIGEALTAVIEEFGRQMLNPVRLPLVVPTPGNRRFRQAMRRLDGVIFEIIRQRRAGGSARDDLLSLLLQAQDDAESAMSDRQLRDELMTLFIGGHETTALALTWAWYLLAGHPEVEVRLAAELQSVLGGRAPTVADVPQLRYAENVVKETLRLYPPAWIVDGRRAVHACELDGYRVPAGAVVGMSQWVIQRDARYFPEPERFMPERWSEAFVKQLPRFAYFPFGGGPRVCIGQGFAMLEATLLLAALAQAFHLDVVPGQDMTPQPTVTLRTRHGLQVVVQPRSG